MTPWTPAARPAIRMSGARTACSSGPRGPTNLHNPSREPFRRDRGLLGAHGTRSTPPSARSRSVVAICMLGAAGRGPRAGARALGAAVAGGGRGLGAAVAGGGRGLGAAVAGGAGAAVGAGRRLPAGRYGGAAVSRYRVTTARRPSASAARSTSSRLVTTMSAPAPANSSASSLRAIPIAPIPPALAA
jgi:hypothetical protein